MFEGRGCAISQASTSMLMEMVKGKTRDRGCRAPEGRLLEEIGIPLTPVRLKCALLGWACSRSRCTGPRERRSPRSGRAWTSSSSSSVALDVCPADELPPGSVKLVRRRTAASGSTTSTASTTRSRIAARTTTGRFARGTGTRGAASSARATGRTSTCAPARRCRSPRRSRSTPSPCASRTAIVKVDVVKRCWQAPTARTTSTTTGVGPADHGRARHLRAALPRGVPVRPLLADDPAQAGELPAAFAGFDPDAVARFDERDVERLLGDAGIVRHRGKIEAAIANARGDARAARDERRCDELVWSYRATSRVAERWFAQTPDSVELSKRLQEGRLPLRRPDDRVRRDAGDRRRQRPPCRLLRPRTRSNARGWTCDRRAHTGGAARLEEEDRVEREAGLPSAQRARQVARRRAVPLLLRRAADGLRGARDRRLARLLDDLARRGVRHLGGRVLSLEHDPAKCEAWRRNIAEAGLDERPIWSRAMPSRRCPRSTTCSTSSSSTRRRTSTRGFRDRPHETRARRCRHRRQRALPCRGARRVFAGATGGRNAGVADPPARPRPRGQRPPPLISGVTAERRWSGLTDSSTGSGGTSG